MSAFLIQLQRHPLHCEHPFPSVGATTVPTDIMDVIVALSSIQGSLRTLQTYPDHYPTNGHMPRVADATRLLGAEVQAWMATGPDAERRRAERRQGAERRHTGPHDD